MNKRITRLIAMLLVMALCVTVLPKAAATEAQAATFKDVGPTHWAYAYIEQAVADGLFKGISSDTFAPELTMNRGMFVTVLSRMAGVSVDDNAKTGFTDVPAGTWFTGAVAWAAEEGITTGITKTTFEPQGGVTRQQAATFLYRYAQKAELVLDDGKAITFTDEADISAYAQKAVAALAAAGIITGYTDGSFQPNKVITRAEAAAMFVRFSKAAREYKETYGVTFMAPHVKVTVDGAETTFCAVEAGSSLTFKLEAEEGYAITSVSTSKEALTAAEDGTYTLRNITEDTSVTVVAEPTAPAAYLVRFEQENAKVYVDGQAVTEAMAEGSLTFAVEADEGYEVFSVTADAGTLTDNGDSTYTLTGLTSAATVHVVATEAEQPPVEETYTVTFVTDGGVMVYVDGVAAQTATVSAEELPFVFGVAMVREHTQIAKAEVSPAGSLYFTGSAYVLSGITGDTTVTLTTGPEMLDVAFYTPDGATAVETVQVAYGELLELPEEPAMEDYFFGGWFTDKDLYYEFRPETPITQDTVLYGGFGKVVDVVHFDSIAGSNTNDGATKETSVLSMGWALKLAEHSTSKSIIMHYAAPVITNVEEVWDASHIDGGITVYMDPDTYTEQGTWAIFTTTGKLTVNNLHFVCEGATETKGACFLYNYSAYDQVANEYTYGNTTLINCSATGFGNLPAGEPGFFNDVIYNLGTLTMVGGEYYGNVGAGGGVVNNYHGYSNFYADGVYFHDNKAPYSEVSIYGDGLGGAIWVNCWVAEIKNCVFENNWAAIGGGAIATLAIDNLVLEDCTFIGNSADGNGGALYTKSTNSKFTIGEGNVFKDNTAKGSGGAIYTANDITLTNGKFENNSANYGNDVYSNRSVVLAPAEGTDLQLPSGITASGGVKISASLANMESDVTVQPTSVAAGTTIASGLDYTLTEADLAKVSVVPAAELVLDTIHNTIKVKEAEGGEDPGPGVTGPVEEEMEGPHNMSEVYLSNSGSDSNDGATPGTAVASFGKAKSLLAKDGIIYLSGRLDVSGNKKWSLDPEQFGSAKLMRHSSYKGWCVAVHGTLELHDIVIDGGDINATSYFLGTNSSYSGNSIILSEGAVIQNCRNTSSYASAINGNGTGDTIIINGGKITNCYAGSSYGGTVRSAKVTMTAGEISNCTGNGYYGGAAIGAKNIEILGGVIYGCASNTSYGGVLYAQSSGTIVIDGGKIHDNTGTYIIGHMGSAPMDIFGGEIYNNTASNSVIGSAYSGGNITLGEVKIYGNKANSGATILIPGSCTLTVNGAEITGNTAKNGGAISAQSSNTYVKLLSGKLSGNTATVDGNEIYAGYQKTVTITPNEAGLEIDGEIYLRNSSTSYFGTEGNYVGDLTNLKGHLNFGFNKVQAGTVVATPVEGHTFTDADLAKLSSYGCNLAYEINADGKIITKAIPLESITLDKTAITVMATYTDTLTAAVGPENASSTNLTWTSSDSAVATVSGNMLNATVKGVAPGTATITATAADGSGLYAECVVTVTENTTPVATLTLNKTTHAMRVEQSVSLSATIAPANAANQTLNWTVSDPTLVELVENGKSVNLKAIGAGEVTVTATTTDGTNLSASCVITIEPRIEIESITLDQTALRLDDGESASLTATVTPDDAWNTTVTWTSSDPAVAAVEGTGKTVTVRALTDGSATITATTADGKTATCQVNVADFPVTDFAVEAASDTVTVYDTISLTAQLEPANAANKAVTWVSSDPAVATVESFGSNAVVYGVKPGTVTVTATTADGGYTDQVTVTVEELTGNDMTLDLTKLDLIVYQSFNITALFEKAGLDVTWTTSNDDVVEILSTTDHQVTIKCGGIAGSATVTATAADGQTATCAINVTGRTAGTLDAVYVHSSEGSDGNDGATSETSVRSLTKAIELLGVDGTIYVEGSSVSLPNNANIALPREIYGDAKIVMMHTHEEVVEEFPWGPEIFEECYAPYFLLPTNGTVYFSDVTISWEDGGDVSSIFGTGNCYVILSNGAKFIGCGSVVGDSQKMGYFYGDSSLLINGGDFSGFGGSSQVFWARERSNLQVNGGHFHDNHANYVFAIDGDSVILEVNGGTFTDNKTPLNVSFGDLYLNGGTFTNSKTGSVSSSNALIYMYEGYAYIQAKYDMKVENYAVYPGTRWAEVYLGTLHNLEGTLGIHYDNRYAVNGQTCFYGMDDRDLTWEELAKVSFAGKTLLLDQDGNRIYLSVK